MEKFDRFGNVIDESCGYARGDILKGPVEEMYKGMWALELLKRRVEEKGERSVLCGIGLSNEFPFKGEDLGKLATGEFSGFCLFQERLSNLALEFLGGDPRKHSVTFWNRGTAGIVMSLSVMAKRGSIVVALAPPPKSHSSIMVGTELAGAELIDCIDIIDFKAALEKFSKQVSVVVITGVGVNRMAIPLEVLTEAITLSKNSGLPIFLDDASGAGVRPVLFGQPKSLQLGVDIAVMSTEKGGLYGPRLGVVGGEKELVAKISSKGVMFGAEIRPPMALSLLRAFENYDPNNLIKTKKWGDELYALAVKRFGKEWLEPMAVGGIYMKIEDCLDILIERANAKGKKPVITPQEACVSVCVALQEDDGIYTIASWGPPGCTFDMRVRPAWPEHGKMSSEEIVSAIDRAFDRVAKICMDKKKVAEFLLGKYMDMVFRQ